MDIRGIYRKSVKNNLFAKTILLFSFITIVTVIAFSYFMFVSMSQSAVRRELDNQKAAMSAIDRYIGLRVGEADSIMPDIYRDDALSLDLSYFLMNPYPDYVRYRLDRYAQTGIDSANARTHMENVLETRPDIRKLVLYSSEQQMLYAFGRDGEFRTVPVNASQSYVPDAMALENASVSVPNAWVSRALGSTGEAMYSVTVPVNDKQSLKNLGQLTVWFDSSRLWNALTAYEQEFNGGIFVLSSGGRVLFDTSGRYYGGKFPYAERLESVYDVNSSGPSPEGGLYFNKLASTSGGYSVAGILTQAEAAESYRGLQNTIWTIGSVCIVFAILVPSLFIFRFVKRTNRIIRLTQRVKRGDLATRIGDPKEDELGQIASSFDDMLDELNQYIDRVYKADIKQKHTELAALQARINPHFLYNTLEVIRMRAVSQGARDVGEMIYSLSMLFKSFVQQKERHTLGDELEACRLYLELFRIRYKDRLAYDIQADPELLKAEVPRLSVQPIVENYIVHGIRSRDDNNRIVIFADGEQGDIAVRVRDNGRGIAADKLREVRCALHRTDENGEAEGGFGLRSVHERLRLLYGADYGIEVHSGGAGQGTLVEIRYRNSEEGERHVQSVSGG
ncbi:cache domain-containing sensor histidine kinase [Saccharibacillus alkalitolerans]|uniref:Sensor histidine kinase n=1 Tax=Saccharibacillus alkalitolerans TaxID=2705290 RepID=A0ABX0F8C8_9BACL|nr:histidine kinase [Saccharibacillus alkalitolerans]NGZ77117.1 sensor histidine kinase [Saccharibacillus alkalitolerans]